MTADLAETLLALDALNSWVRTPGGRDSWGASYVVYWLKLQGLLRAQAEGATTHRRIALLSKCRGCGGTGRYVDSCGHEFDHHYECNSKGVVELEFIETTIELPDRKLVWHTPEREAGRIDYQWRDWVQHRELSWMPNQSGRELEPDEAARLFNLVESRIPHHTYRPRYIYDLNQEWDDFATYKLHCGAAPADLCGVCGAPNDGDFGFGCSTGRAHWTGYACKACQAAIGGGVAVHRALEGRPPALLAQPNIKEWIARHPVALKER